MMSSNYEKVSLIDFLEIPASASTGNGSQDEENGEDEEDEVNNPLRNHPIGSWGTGLFECHSNLYPSCFCATFVCGGFWLLGQMAQFTGYARFNLLWFIYCSSLVASIILFATGDPLFEELALVETFLASLLMGLRLHIVRNRRIAEWSYDFNSWQNICIEGCVGACCYTCAVAQQARYLFRYTRMIDGDGKIALPLYSALPATPMNV